MKSFPIPVVAVAIGPGSQTEDETLDYLALPQGMQTYHPPRLPEPEELRERRGAHRVLRQALAELQRVREGAGNLQVDLHGLTAEELRLVNQVLGEGEVSAIVAPAHPGGPTLQVQESVFAGIWRVVASVDGAVSSDVIEIGPVPAALHAAAADDVTPAPPRWTGALPPNVQNAPALLAEIEDRCRDWTPDQAPHVVNLTLLPMSPEDISFLDHHLGTGRVTILSRGYGNCRITNTRRPHGWRVVYYNSQDTVILNTVELSALPEVALASPEDLADTGERLGEMLAWLEET